jgi:bile acid-coenzyme A ligase
MICDADGDEVPVGVTGEVRLRSGRPRKTYRYVGAEARLRDGGWESLGDNGCVSWTGSVAGQQGRCTERRPGCGAAG